MTLNIELKELTAGEIASVKRIGENGDIYSAFLAFATYACKSIDGIEDEQGKKEILKKTPFDDVYAIAIKGMMLTKGVDKIEGKYQCSCGAIIDHTGEYADEISMNTDTSEDITIPVKVDITNAKTGESILLIESLTMRHATVDDLIKAYRKFPDDNSKMQFEVYKNCILLINGKEIDNSTRINYGDLIFSKMGFKDINMLTKALDGHFGEIECVCMKCKKRFKTKVDLSNFLDTEVE